MPVTWGAPQTKLYTPSTPASTTPGPGGFGFGGAAATPPNARAPTNLFAGSTPGAASTSAFGGFAASPAAPAPAANSLFGATIAGIGSPAVGNSAFGGFGVGSPAPTAAAGSTTFLSPNPNAAMGGGASPYHHAHVAAHLREEQSRIESQLLQLANGYSTTPMGNAAPPPSSLFGPAPGAAPQQQQFNSLCRFQCLLYDPVDHLPAPGATSAPPQQRPLHIDVSDWAQAQAYNPRPATLKPVSIVGAAALQTRVIGQQERATKLEQHVKQVEGALNTLDSSVQQSKRTIENLSLNQIQLEQRLLNFMYKLHLIKCALLGKQGGRILSEERDWINKMNVVKTNLRQLEHFCSTNLHQQVTQVRQEQSRSGGGQQKKLDDSMATTLSLQEQDEFHQVLQKTQVGLQELKKIVTRDLRDIKILMQEVGVKSGPLATPVAMR